MSYGKQQLEELALKLSKISDMLNYELPEFWWLSQGEEAVVIVRIVRKNKGLKIYETPKLTLKAAIKTVVNSIEVAKKLKGKEFYQVIKIIEEDIASIVEVYSLIKEAHQLVKKAEHLRRILSKSSMDADRKNRLKSMLDEVVKWIREIFTTNPKEWRNKKDFFGRALDKMEKEILESQAI